MQHRIARITALSASLALAVGLAGCSAGGTEQASDAQGDARTVTVAVENDSKPLSYTGDDGQLTGYEVELLRAVDDKLDDVSFDIQSASADGTSIGLDTGKYALIGGGLYKTAERQDKYLLAGPTGASAIRIYREKGASIATLDDLVGKKVAPVTPAGGIFNLLTDYNTEHPDAQITIEANGSITTAEALAGVSNGQYDAQVSPSNLGQNSIIEAQGLNVEAAPDPVKINETFFALSKDDADLKDEVDSALQQLRDDGTFKRLSEQFFGEDNTQYLQ